MLAAAESALRPKLPEGSRLSLVESTAEDFVPPTGWKADLVTICRAFHWLDQAAELGEQSVLCLPLGSIEQHGPHLPLDTDTIIAERFAYRLPLSKAAAFRS